MSEEIRPSKKYRKFFSFARPFTLWVMSLSIAYYYLIAPILHSIFSLYGLDYKLPEFDQAGLNTLIIGLLGSSALRTFEKFNDVQGNH